MRPPHTRRHVPPGALQRVPLLRAALRALCRHPSRTGQQAEDALAVAAGRRGGGLQEHAAFARAARCHAGRQSETALAPSAPARRRRSSHEGDARAGGGRPGGARTRRRGRAAVCLAHRRAALSVVSPHGAAATGGAADAHRQCPPRPRPHIPTAGPQPAGRRRQAPRLAAEVSQKMVLAGGTLAERAAADAREGLRADARQARNVGAHDSRPQTGRI